MADFMVWHDATAGVTGAAQKPGGMCSGAVVKALI